jgi:hypothetical protein
LPPARAIYPVGDLGRSLRDVAPDRADEPSIADDRPKPVLRRGHDLPCGRRRRFDRSGLQR